DALGAAVRAPECKRDALGEKAKKYRRVSPQQLLSFQGMSHNSAVKEVKGNAVVTKHPRTRGSIRLHFGKPRSSLRSVAGRYFSESEGNCPVACSGSAADRSEERRLRIKNPSATAHC